MWQSTLGDFSSPLERITALLYYYTPSTATMARMAPGVEIVPAREYSPCSANLAAILRRESPAWCRSRAMMPHDSNSYGNTFLRISAYSGPWGRGGTCSGGPQTKGVCALPSGARI